MTDWTLGYKTNINEGEITNLKIIGTIPSSLNGVLIRNGPADFEAGAISLNSWIDGFSKLHSLRINKDKIVYNRKFLKTQEYINSNKLNHLVFEEFNTNSLHPRLNKLRSLFEPFLTDNASVNVFKIKDDYVAMSETSPSRIKFNIDDLEMNSYFKFNDNIKEHLGTAHLLYDKQEDVYYGFSTLFGIRSKYIVYKFRNELNTKREIIKIISINAPSYMHSFAMTKKHIILIENPIRINPTRFLFSTKTLAEQLKLDHKIKTDLIVINKVTGNIRKLALDTSFFTFHTVNAFDTNEGIILDLIPHSGLGFVKDMNLKTLYHKHIRNKLGGDLRRYAINLKNLEKSRVETIFKGCIELPVISADSTGILYKFVYALNMNKPNQPYNQIIKINTESKEYLIWEEEGCYPSEPAFVPNTNQINEDDGYLLSFITNIKDLNSFVLILNAKTFQEEARIIIPEVIPFGSHGRFFETTS